MHIVINIISEADKCNLIFVMISGQVELENLPLRKDALKGLDLPLEVKSGTISKYIFLFALDHV